MRIVIVGAGQAGLSVAVHLSRSGHEVTVIDGDRAVTERATQQHGLVSLTGDGTDANLLSEAEIERAEVVVATLRRDADNLAVALLSKSHGVPRVMVRMRDVNYRPVYIAAGVDRILSETDVFIGALATAIEHDAVRHAMLLGNGGSVAFEVAVPEKSPIAGKTVGEIASQRDFPRSCVFAGLYQPDGTVEGPRGSSIVSAGMTVLLVARRDELRRTIEYVIGDHER